MFPGFPGVWHPDAPIAVSALGFAGAKDAERAAKELGLPLKTAKADVTDAAADVSVEVVAGLPDAEAGDA